LVVFSQIVGGFQPWRRSINHVVITLPGFKWPAHELSLLAHTFAAKKLPSASDDGKGA
jgi:hypothetical protein